MVQRVSSRLEEYPTIFIAGVSKWKFQHVEARQDENGRHGHLHECVEGCHPEGFGNPSHCTHPIRIQDQGYSMHHQSLTLSGRIAVVYDKPTEPTADQLKKIQQEVNGIIVQNVPVTVTKMARSARDSLVAHPDTVPGG